MSDKKKGLLTESEIRRFMKLANIPAVGNVNEMHVTQMDHGGHQAIAEEFPQEEGMAMPHMEDEGEETMELGDELGGEEEAAGAVSPEVAKTVVQAVLNALGVKGTVEDVEDAEGGEPEEAPEGGEGEEEMPEPEEEPEGGEEDSEEDGEESDEEEQDDEEETDESAMSEAKHEEDEGEEHPKKKKKEQMDESLVENVLARVTARLIAEAKKKKAEKKKKMSAAEKMKAMKAAKEKKKKLEEANAPAPKSSMSNSSKAGVAKGHGPGSKAWGTSEKGSQEWKEGKNTKGSHEMETVAASSEHSVSHGNKNLATLGGNKKK